MAARVLLVEDSARLRQLIERILEQGGYEVRSVTSAAEAMHILESEPGFADLMIADMMLPDASGLELSRKAAAIAPEIKVLHTSGFDLEVPDGVEFISKPFRPDELLSRVATLLG